MAKGQLSEAERWRADDLAEADLVGEMFGLGIPDEVERDWHDRSRIGAPGFVVVGMAPFCGGIFLIAGGWRWLAGNDKLAFAAIVGGSVIAGAVMVAIGAWSTVVRARYFAYPAGAAQLVRGEPEPRVLRWADIETITITAKNYEDDEDGKTGIATFTLAGPAGHDRSRDRRRGRVSDRNREITGKQRGTGSRPGLFLVDAAYREAAPRLLPPMIAAYESGEALIAGKFRADSGGVTMPDGEGLPWGTVAAVTMNRHRDHPGGTVVGIDFRQHGGRVHRLSLSGVPNGIFLADVIAHAASRHGVQVNGRREPDTADS